MRSTLGFSDSEELPLDEETCMGHSVAIALLAAMIGTMGFGALVYYGLVWLVGM